MSTAQIIEAPGVTAELVDVEMSNTGWRPVGAMSFEQWENAGRQLQQMGRAWQWWIGDWIAYGEHTYGERYAQAVDVTGLEYQTVANVVSVAKRVDPDRRREDLPWSHHEAVAALEPAEQDRWLHTAQQQGMTRDRLRSALRADRDDQPPPGDEPIAPTHRATITFLLAADSDEDAHDRVKNLAARLERAGAQVTHKQYTPVNGL